MLTTNNRKNPQQVWMFYCRHEVINLSVVWWVMFQITKKCGRPMWSAVTKLWCQKDKFDAFHEKRNWYNYFCSTISFPNFLFSVLPCIAYFRIMQYTIIHIMKVDFSKRWFAFFSWCFFFVDFLVRRSQW